MEEVVRQNNPFVLGFLDHMRNGTMQNDDIDFIYSKCLANLTPVEKKKFDNALNLVTQWKEAHSIVFDYLQNTLTEPIAKMIADLQTTKSNGKNCLVKESSYPLKNAMCVNSIVMLLTNELVEMGLLNGSIGIVKDICYQTNDSMGQKKADFYVVVEFKDSTLETPLIPGKPTTWVPVALSTQRCECKRCTITAIPLRVCKALTIYKSQGMTVSPGKPFESLVVHLPTKGTKRAAGSELVGCSRVTAPEVLAFGNDPSKLSRLEIKKIGTTDAYGKRRNFLNELKQKAQPSQQRTIDGIRSLADNAATYDSGCQFLLDWYEREYMNINQN